MGIFDLSTTSAAFHPDHYPHCKGYHFQMNHENIPREFLERHAYQYQGKKVVPQPLAVVQAVGLPHRALDNPFKRLGLSWGCRRQPGLPPPLPDLSLQWAGKGGLVGAYLLPPTPDF
jgi:hypothetical protein